MTVNSDSADACVTVVLASEGYPASPRTGDVIEGLDAADAVEGVTVFHAGTKAGPEQQVLTAGGRVLNVCATGRTLMEAHDAAYAAVAKIDWPGGFYRRDIGWRALSR